MLSTRRKQQCQIQSCGLKVAGKNGDELCEFYRSLFGWDISSNTNGVHLCDPGSDQGIKGHIFPTTDEMPYTNQITIYISVEDLQAAVAKVESNGGNILIPPTDIPDDMGFFCNVHGSKWKCYRLT